MLAGIALLLSVGIAVADPASSDWNDSWGFLTPSEKANLLNQALAIELVENDGFDIDNYSYQNCNEDGACFWGTAQSIGNQLNVDGDDNNILGNDIDNDGNVSSQVNNGSGEIEQEVEN